MADQAGENAIGNVLTCCSLSAAEPGRLLSRSKGSSIVEDGLPYVSVSSLDSEMGRMASVVVMLPCVFVVIPRLPVVVVLADVVVFLESALTELNIIDVDWKVRTSSTWKVDDS